MKSLRYLWAACRWCAAGLADLGLWTLWLGLALALVLQIVVACTSELEVPRFVLQDLEQRLEASGVRAKFGRTLFDPSGRILVENVRLWLPGFPDPVISARAVYARIDPWALLANRFEPLELRATGVDLRVPAMLAPSGGADEGVHDLDAELRPRGDELDLASLSCRLGTLAITARGTIHLGSFQAGAEPGLPIAGFLARNYRALIQEAAGIIGQLGALDQPILRTVLVPSESNGAIVHATLTARGLRLPIAGGLTATGLRVTGRFPLLPTGPINLEVAAEAAQLRLTHPAATAQDVQATISGTVAPHRIRPGLQQVEFTAAAVTAGGLTVPAPIISAGLGALPRVQAEVSGWLFGIPVASAIEADLATGAATARFDGAVAPAAVNWLGARLGRDLGPYFALGAPLRLDGTADFDAGWKFRRAGAAIDGRAIRAHGVMIDEARGEVSFDGHRLVAPWAYVRVGRNFARGSYAGEVASRRYRFLIEGALRPMEIAPWFAKWWSEFFGNFQFPSAAPVANIDLQGRWGTDRYTAAFIWVDSDRPVIRGAAFDRARARLFVRPHFEDGLEFRVTRGAGTAQGTFARWADPATNALRRLDFNLSSTVDFPLAARVFGPEGADILEPFGFDLPPTVRLQAHIDGASAPGGPHEDLRIEARTDGGFHFHDFPFENAVFTAVVHDDVIAVGPVSAGFAGGRVTGGARVAGRGADQRITLNCRLADANLGRAVAVLQAFSARHQSVGTPKPPPLLTEKADERLDLTAVAAGRYDDPLGLHGTGTASVHGSNLFQVPLLGFLSQVINITSLRFTNARADFSLDGPQIAFPDIAITGANSAILGHGSYNVDRHALDINARVFPFRESKFLLPQVMNVVTAPLSQVLEVRLTGSLDRPHWAFVAGPTNLLRNLLGSGPAQGTPAPAPAPPAAHP